MANEKNANIRDTVTAIDFISMARIYAPPGNDIIQNMLLDYEKIFFDCCFNFQGKTRCQLRQ